MAAHAHGTEGIKRAIKAGVASVEHASFIDDEGIRLAKERGTYLVMDIYNDDYILAEFARRAIRRRSSRRSGWSGRTQRENFKKAVQAGVKMAYGTDAGVYPHGWNGKQFAKMVEWGMTPMQAIQAATVDAAELLGLARPDRRDRGRPVRRPDRGGRRSAQGRHRARAREFRDEGRRRLQALTTITKARGREAEDRR